MESTGVFWKPVYNLLEGRLEVLLVNAQHVKQGGSQDGREGLPMAGATAAVRAAAGQLHPPPAAAGDAGPDADAVAVGGLTHRFANRMHKALEDANIRWEWWRRTSWGSGRDMIRALIQGEQDTEKMAEMARRRLREKIPNFAWRCTDASRTIIGSSWRSFDAVDQRENLDRTVHRPSRRSAALSRRRSTR